MVKPKPRFPFQLCGNTLRIHYIFINLVAKLTSKNNEAIPRRVLLPLLRPYPPLAMAGRRLLAPLLLLLLLQLPAPPQAYASPGTDADSGRCPRPEEFATALAAALRRTCRATTEGRPADEVRVSDPSSGLVASWD
jgi:hypothetical protein